MSAIEAWRCHWRGCGHGSLIAAPGADRPLAPGDVVRITGYLDCAGRCGACIRSPRPRGRGR